MNEIITPKIFNLSISLLDNGIDFVVKGFDELELNDFDPKYPNITELELENYKYGITNLYTGFLLLLKECLYRYNPDMIFTGKAPKQTNKSNLTEQGRKTINLSQSLYKLEKGPGVIFSLDDKNIIDKIGNLRNSFVHYKVQADKVQVNADLIPFIELILDFVHKELEIDIDEYSDKSKRFGTKFQQKRKKMIEYGGSLEWEVYKLLSSFSGFEVPGKFLHSDEDFIIPKQIQMEKPNLFGTTKFIPDMVGVDISGNNVLIEVIGPYIPRENAQINQRLETFHGYSENSKVWLIVLGDVPKSIEERALELKIFLTDINNWVKLRKYLKARDR